MAHILDLEPGTWGEPRPLSAEVPGWVSCPGGSERLGAPGQSPEAWDDSETRQWAPEKVQEDGLGLPRPCPSGADPTCVCVGVP